MADSEKGDVTQLLLRMRHGDAASANALMEHIYRELRRLASGYMRKERRDHTLQPTALVHEAYMHIIAGEAVDWQSRAHFFAVAARQMRLILVDHARGKNAEKRGSGGVKVSFDDLHVAGVRRDEDVEALNEALERLERQDARAGRVVELKYFGGLTDAETAEALGISVPAVRRDWEFAKAWLFDHLARTEG